MKLSTQKRAALYQAIRESVLDARIVLRSVNAPDHIDFTVAQMEMVIWRRVLRALNITEADPA